MSDEWDDDPLAEERTSLAWGRTSLAMLASGAAILKGLPSVTGIGARPLVGGVIVALAAISWLYGLWNQRTRRLALVKGDLAAEGSLLQGLAFSTVVIGLVALAVALVG